MNNELVFAANILLDCDEMIKEGLPVLDYIKAQCHKHGIQKHQDDLLKVVSRVSAVYNIGKVSMDYGEENIT